MNCPACGYYNPQGQLACIHCALPLPIAAGDAQCAAHPEVKATGACSRCGTFGCGNCLSARGRDWLCANCLARVGVLPWEERDTLGMWRAWWRTSVLMISSPGVLSTAEPEASLGSSMLFALLSTIAGYVPTLACVGVVMVPSMLLGSLGASGGKAALMGLTSIFVVLVYAVIIFVFQLGSVLFIAGLDHVGLLLVGAQPRSYTVTVRAHALSMGPFLVGILPICSIYVFPMWSVVLRVIANMHLHKTTAGKATAAVLLPMVLLCGGVFALYVAVVALAVGLSR